MTSPAWPPPTMTVPTRVECPLMSGSFRRRCRSRVDGRKCGRPTASGQPPNLVADGWVVLCSRPARGRPGRQAVLVRVRGRGSPAGDAELAEDVAHVARHGLLREEEPSG